MRTKPDAAYASKPEVAAYLGVHVRTVERYLAEKQLTGRRLGTGHIRIAWSEVKRKFPQ